LEVKLQDSHTLAERVLKLDSPSAAFAFDLKGSSTIHTEKEIKIGGERSNPQSNPRSRT
jgi:hypothetical protein